MERGKFESGGPAAQNVGMASAAFPVFIASLAGLAFSLWAAVSAVLFAITYLMGYAGFFRFVLEKRPAFLPPAVLLNGYFCFVISAGAVCGVLSYLFGRKNDAS